MQVWDRPDVIQQLTPHVDVGEIQRLRDASAALMDAPKYKDMANPLDSLPTADDFPSPLCMNLAADAVSVGTRSDLSETQFSNLNRAILALQPWRKGPFRLFDYEIDAEWRSNLKWDRIADGLGDLNGQRILDVGCGNGYYMFRAAAQDPEIVLGMDPSIQFFYSFELLQRFLQLKNVQYERLGAEHLYVFDQAFDLALCMGVLYHRKNPLEVLESLRRSLRVGGSAIIESQTIPGESTTALFPEDRYAKARNVFFMPTKDCLINWVRRSGFKDVQLIDHVKVTSHEQRKTKLMTFESLADFLDPEDDSLTIEGYPAPYRTVVRGVRKFL